LLATTNSGKIREYRFLLGDLGYQIVTLAEQGINEVASELGNSYEQNAQLKAATYAGLTRLITIADDSGLEVDALDGEPGIHSARFAGKDATDADRMRMLLAKLADIPWEKRGAHFRCVIAIVRPEGQSELCDGECHGTIAFEARGENGFGYDPIFYLPEMGKTMAEVSFEVKNQVSHRAQASRKAREVLERLSA
ncbi:MAG: RdgB/HAM1 family non-canonical purine NTP pyrophosphatase, partial [Chloroflexi bacterium]|nr:RdgB/HAM1 family non-canonical purine NTP pyrophosphatase [Chloroflexota bacterium]